MTAMPRLSANDARAELRLYASPARIVDLRYGPGPDGVLRANGCPCVCNSGGFCGGCGHAGCGGR